MNPQKPSMISLSKAAVAVHVDLIRGKKHMPDHIGSALPRLFSPLGHRTIKDRNEITYPAPNTADPMIGTIQCIDR